MLCHLELGQVDRLLVYHKREWMTILQDCHNLQTQSMVKLMHVQLHTIESTIACFFAIVGDFEKNRSQQY